MTFFWQNPAGSLRENRTQANPAVDAWGEKVWIPSEEPYRVQWIKQSDRPGLSGWEDVTKVYATEAEAVAAAKEKFPAGVYRVYVEVYDEGAPSHRGWRPVGWRDRKQEYKTGRRPRR